MGKWFTIWLAHISHMGWSNHQLEKSMFSVNPPKKAVEGHPLVNCLSTSANLRRKKLWPSKGEYHGNGFPSSKSWSSFVMDLRPVVELWFFRKKPQRFKLVNLNCDRHFAQTSIHGSFIVWFVKFPLKDLFMWIQLIQKSGTPKKFTQSGDAVIPVMRWCRTHPVELWLFHKK